jgi:DNA-binding response OmpR family regulator
MMESSSVSRRQKILVVDDNEYTLAILRHTLERAGYIVLCASSGEEALGVLETQGLPHLAIVDYHMPAGMSGFRFCEIVHQYADLPVIMLTAVHDADVILEGLEIHAEDYIQKPFSPAVLLARVRRVLQRLGSFEAQPLIQVDERLAINFTHQEAYLDGKLIPLTPTETKLLYLLMRRAGEPVNTDFILRRIWPQEMAFEDRLHVHVHRLRRKLKHESPYIVSQRGRGYQFRAS